MIKKSFYLSLLLSAFGLSNNLFTAQLTKQNTTVEEQPTDEQREYFQNLTTEVRDQMQSINYCVQQLIQALSMKKINLSDKQIENTTKELITINEMINSFLDNIFVQINPEHLYVGLIINTIISEYLFTTIKTDISKISAQKLNELIEKTFSKEQKSIIASPDALLTKSKKNIKDLLNATDVVGLTWYNHTYRFLKRHHATEYLKGTALLATTAFISAYVYHLYHQDDQGHFSKLLEKIFGHIAKPEKLDVTEIHTIDYPNEPIISYQVDKINAAPGKGAFGYFERACNALSNGTEIIRNFTARNSNLIPLLAFLDYKDLYSSYYLSYKAKLANGMQKLDSYLAGTETKHTIGDCENIYFKNMTGAEHLKDLAKKITNYLMHPERYERAKIEEHRCILLYGPPQTGKTLFAKALRTMINENFGKDKKINFIDAKSILDRNPRMSMDDIFDYAAHIAPTILFFDEIDLMGTHREKNAYSTGQLLTNIQGVDMLSKQVIIIGATNKIEQLDKALLVDGRFSKIIHIDYPNYFQRKSFLEKEINKRNIAIEPTFIDNMAQETEGASYNNLNRIISEALISSTNALRPIVQADFEKALDSEIRKIAKPDAYISEEEKNIIATYQAGKALMRHLLQTKREVVKVTILPVGKAIKSTEYSAAIKTNDKSDSENDRYANETKEQRLKDGEVFTKTLTANNAMISDAETQKECLVLLAGYVAQKILLQNSFSQCNPHDRADALKIIGNMLAQGEKVDTEMTKKALAIKETYEKEIEKLLLQHKDLLIKLVQELMKKNTIDRYEWQNLVHDYKIS